MNANIDSNSVDLILYRHPDLCIKVKKNHETCESWDKDMNPWEIYQIQTELVNFNNTPIWTWEAEMKDFRRRK